MKLIKILPNFLTLLNGICGCIAIIFIFGDRLTTIGTNYEIALVLVLIGAILDFLDGYIAKILNARSKIGIQLDSLSDLITFSLAPSFLVYDFFQNMSTEYELLPFFSFLIIPFSMVRLARFNTLPAKSYFLGLPTPANGLFFMGLPFLSIDFQPLLFVFVVIVSCFLLVSNIKFESFKKDFNKKNKNFFYITFLILSSLAFVCFVIYEVSLLNLVSATIIIYVLSSLLFNAYKAF